MFLPVECQQAGTVAMDQRLRGDHFCIQACMPRVSTVEIPAVPVGTIHHRGHCQPVRVRFHHLLSPSPDWVGPDSGLSQSGCPLHRRVRECRRRRVHFGLVHQVEYLRKGLDGSLTSGARVHPACISFLRDLHRSLRQFVDDLSSDERGQRGNGIGPATRTRHE